MKKLFFAAILAIVAIGGAYAQQQYTFNSDGSGTRFICEDNEGPTCFSMFVGAYEYPSGTYVPVLPDRLYQEI